MDKFGSVELRLAKDVKMGDKESLLSLFDVLYLNISHAL